MIEKKQIPEMVFILVEPVVPENVGFVCRAIKNMGWSELRIVRSKAQQSHLARNTAYKSHEILEEAKVYDDLQSASEGLDLLIATTGKDRKMRNQLISSDRIRSYLEHRTNIVSKAGIVFGSETNGLNADDLSLCQVLTTIPMAQPYPSINLSHSVMVYAYELRRIQSVAHNDTNESIPFAVYHAALNDILIKADVAKRQPELYQKTLDRMMTLDPSDIKIFMTLLRYLKKEIE
ncbi:MAG: tRNA/rRNA methyltransferase [Cyclobacteriaceae bacterium]|jgi:tRNA/rRNA methyltransferase